MTQADLDALNNIDFTDYGKIKHNVPSGGYQFWIRVKKYGGKVRLRDCRMIKWDRSKSKYDKNHIIDRTLAMEVSFDKGVIHHVVNVPMTELYLIKDFLIKFAPEEYRGAFIKGLLEREQWQVSKYVGNRFIDMARKIISIIGE